MKDKKPYISGFSIIRNAVKYDYPIVEAIMSVLPIVDEFVLLVGNSEDSTLALVSNISPKVKIHHSLWDDNLRKGGQVLAIETNKALELINEKSSWAFYIQGDEVLPEQYHDDVLAAMVKADQNSSVDGLLFKYLHFYGSYDYVGTSTKWYRNEIRAFKTKRAVYSFRDAQGFRKRNNKMLVVIPTDITMYHYGWVRPPATMQTKTRDFQKFWHQDELINKMKDFDAATFNYENIDLLSKFDGEHPRVMLDRINNQNWTFDRDISINKASYKERIRQWIYRKTGWLPGEYRNYVVGGKG